MSSAIVTQLYDKG